MVSEHPEKDAVLASLDERLARAIEKLNHISPLSPSTPSIRSMHDEAPPLSNPSCDDEASCTGPGSVTGERRDCTSPKAASVNSPKYLNSYKRFFSISERSLPLSDPCEHWSNPSSTPSLSQLANLKINSPWQTSTDISASSIQESISSQSSPLVKNRELAVGSPHSHTSTIAEQLRRLRNEYKSKLQLVDQERRHLKSAIAELNTNKQELKRSQRKLNHLHEKHAMDHHEEKVKLKHKHKQLTMEKQEQARKARELEEKDFSMLEKLETVGESGRYILDDSTKDRWQRRVSEERQNYMKEKDKYTALHLALAGQKSKLEEMKIRLDSDRRDIRQQKQLFKTSQQLYDKEQKKLSNWRTLVETGAKKLRKIKECISNETSKLAERKRLLQQEQEEFKSQQEEFEKQKEDFQEERTRIIELDSKVKAELRALADRQKAIEHDKSELDKLSQEVLTDKQRCVERELQNSRKESTLQQLDREISEIIQSEKAEQEATKILNLLVTPAEAATNR